MCCLSARSSAVRRKRLISTVADQLIGRSRGLLPPIPGEQTAPTVDSNKSRRADAKSGARVRPPLRTEGQAPRIARDRAISPPPSAATALASSCPWGIRTHASDARKSCPATPCCSGDAAGASVRLGDNDRHRSIRQVHPTGTYRRAAPALRASAPC